MCNKVNFEAVVTSPSDLYVCVCVYIMWNVNMNKMVGRKRNVTPWLVLCWYVVSFVCVNGHPEEVDAFNEQEDKSSFRNAYSVAFSDGSILSSRTAFLLHVEPVLDTIMSLPLLHSLTRYVGVPPSSVYLLDEWLPLRCKTCPPNKSPHQTQRNARYSTWHPWVKAIYEQRKTDGSNTEWYVLCTAHTRFNFDNVEKLMREHKEDQGGGIFGYALLDKNPKIIHHYYTHPNFTYPMIARGVVLHQKVLDRLFISENEGFESSIHVDPFHSFFQHIFERTGEVVIHRPAISWALPSAAAGQRSSDVAAPTFTKREIQQRQFIGRQLAILVKSTEKYHSTRLAQIKQLWANPITMRKAVYGGDDVPLDLVDWSTVDDNLPVLQFMSDANDVAHGTLDLGSGNTNRGHCAKFSAILRHFFTNLPSRTLLCIVDDDTLVNVSNLIAGLVQLLFRPLQGISSLRYPHTCTAPNDDYIWKDEYDQTIITNYTLPISHTKFSIRDAYEASINRAEGSRNDHFNTFFFSSSLPLLTPLYLGERYSYGHWAGRHGYDYLTTGGGIVLDRIAVGEVMNCRLCHCPRADSPDDMLLGLWMQRLNIPAIHSAGFHQATPADYHIEVLKAERGDQPPSPRNPLRPQGMISIPISFHRIDTKDPRVAQQRFDNYLKNWTAANEDIQKQKAFSEDTCNIATKDKKVLTKMDEL